MEDVYCLWEVNEKAGHMGMAFWAWVGVASVGCRFKRYADL